jgi:putative ABC transport system permease protein
MRIVLLLSREFTRWVLLANVIAWPAAYVAMNLWLKSFAYRISLGLLLFFAAGMVTFLVALFTVSFQAVKAARSDPVYALRYE